MINLDSNIQLEKLIELRNDSKEGVGLHLFHDCVKEYAINRTFEAYINLLASLGSKNRQYAFNLLNVGIAGSGKDQVNRRLLLGDCVKHEKPPYALVPNCLHKITYTTPQALRDRLASSVKDKTWLFPEINSSLRGAHAETMIETLKQILDGGKVRVYLKEEGIIEFDAEANIIGNLNTLDTYNEDQRALVSRFFIIPFFVDDNYIFDILRNLKTQSFDKMSWKQLKDYCWLSSKLVNREVRHTESLENVDIFFKEYLQYHDVFFDIRDYQTTIKIASLDALFTNLKDNPVFVTEQSYSVALEYLTTNLDAKSEILEKRSGANKKWEGEFNIHRKKADCSGCNYSWLSFIDNPVRCPRCRKLLIV